MMNRLVSSLLLATLVWAAGCKQHIARQKNEKDASPKQVEQAVASFKSDSDFLQRVAQEARGEIELAQLAQSKAQSPEVKAFAEQIIKDNTSLTGEVEKLASAQNVTLPTDLDSVQQEHKSKLEQKSGSDFDKDYMKEALARVQNMNKLFEGAVQKADSQQVKDFATVNLISLRDAMDRATGTAKKVGA